MKILNAWISPEGIVYHVEHGDHARFAGLWIKANDKKPHEINEAFDEELVFRGWKILSQRENGPLFVLPHNKTGGWPAVQREKLESLLEEYGLSKGDTK